MGKVGSPLANGIAGLQHMDILIIKIYKKKEESNINLIQFIFLNSMIPKFLWTLR